MRKHHPSSLASIHSFFAAASIPFQSPGECLENVSSYYYHSRCSSKRRGVNYPDRDT